MKFSIQDEGQEKQIFFTFREASEKTGLTSKTIVRVLKSGNGKYFRRADKKTFWIQKEESSPFIQIDGEDFFSAEEVQERFELSRTVLFNQLCKRRTHFLDSQEKSHEVTWLSPSLEEFIDLVKKEKMCDKVYFQAQGRGRGKGKGKKNFFVQSREEVRSARTDSQNSF